MVSKKRLIIDQIQAKSSATPEKALSRMSIYDLNTLLGTLNGTPQEELKTIDEATIPKPKLNRKVRKKIRKAKTETETETENEIVNETQPTEWIEKNIDDDDTDDDDEEEEELPPPPPKKRGRPKKSEDKRKNVSVLENVEVLEKPTRISRAMNSQKAEVKELLSDFKKEVTKLLLQYKRLKNKTEQHKDILIDTYNDIYDTTVHLIEDQISSNYFPDDRIFDYAEKMMMSERTRIEKVLR